MIDADLGDDVRAGARFTAEGRRLIQSVHPMRGCVAVDATRLQDRSGDRLWPSDVRLGRDSIVPMSMLPLFSGGLHAELFVRIIGVAL